MRNAKKYLDGQLESKGTFGRLIIHEMLGLQELNIGIFDWI
jgi:hypothetical protein